MKRLIEALITIVAVSIMLFPAVSGLLFFVRESSSLEAQSSDSAQEIESTDVQCTEIDFNLCHKDAF